MRIGEISFFTNQGLLKTRTTDFSLTLSLYNVRKNFCFVEDYDFLGGKGKISVLELNPEGEKYLGVALEDEFHLSYPFIF